MKYIPIDKETKNMVMPILDLTTNHANPFAFAAAAADDDDTAAATPHNAPMKRVVSETKKKYVAAQNDWKCSACNMSLPYYYEVDHVIALKDGGTNDATNLRALCANCHKQKTLATYL
jgi:hypothetical protein